MSLTDLARSYDVETDIGVSYPLVTINYECFDQQGNQQQNSINVNIPAERIVNKLAQINEQCASFKFELVYIDLDDTELSLDIKKKIDDLTRFMRIYDPEIMFPIDVPSVTISYQCHNYDETTTTGEVIIENTSLPGHTITNKLAEISNSCRSFKFNVTIHDDPFNYLPLVRCTCNKVIGDIRDKFIRLIQMGDPPEVAFNKLNLRRICCRQNIANVAIMPHK